MLNCCYANGKHLFQQAYDALEPGGWIEFQDVPMPIRADDGTMDGTNWGRWNEMFVDAMIRIGRPSDNPQRYEQWMREIGYVNVTRRDFKWPQNPWPKHPAMKELGRWHMVNTLDGLHGFTARTFTTVLGLTPEEVEVLLVGVRKDIMDRRIHAYWPV